MGRNVALAICQWCGLQLAHRDLVREPDTGAYVHRDCMDETEPRRNFTPKQVDISVTPALPDTDIAVED